MYSRKILLSKRSTEDSTNNKSEQLQTKDQTVFRERNSSISFQNNILGQNFFFKNQEIQDNSIIEEDDYNFEIYNYPIMKDENFLFGENIKDKCRTLPVPNYNYFVNDNNMKKYCISTETNSNSLSIKENGNENEIINDENINNLMGNINIFKNIRKERKNIKFLNNILFRDDRNKKKISDSKFNKNNPLNKFSKKNRKKNNQKNGIDSIKRHSKNISEPFNGIYLRKNKVQINSIKSINQIVSNNKPRNTINIKDDIINSRNNNSKITEVRKHIFPSIETDIHKKMNTLDVEDKINSYNNKKDDIKNNILEQCNGCFCQKENNYIFNLKFYNIYNNNDNDNIDNNINSHQNQYSKSKSKSKTKYFSKEKMFNEKKNNNNNNINNNEIESPNRDKKKTKKNIIKRRVIFEEEYMIDQDGNHKFICIKRVDSHSKNNNKQNNQKNRQYNNKNNNNNNNNQCSIERDSNNKNYIACNLLTSAKNKKYRKRIEPNVILNNSSRRIIEEKIIQKKNNEKNVDSKKGKISLQMSCENLCPLTNNNSNNINNTKNNNNLKNKMKTQIQKIEIKDSKQIQKNEIKDSKQIQKIEIKDSKQTPNIIRYKQITKLNNNNNTQKERKNVAHSKRSISNIIDNISYISNQRSKNCTRYSISLKKPINDETYEEERINYNKNNPKPLLTRITKNYKILQENINNNYNSRITNTINNSGSDILEDRNNSKNYIYKSTCKRNNNTTNLSAQEILPVRSERKNYRYHEIKSTSKRKIIEDLDSSIKKNLNSYFDSKKNNSTITSNISMEDAIKNNYNDCLSKIKQRLRQTHKKEIKNISFSNQKINIFSNQDKKS